MSPSQPASKRVKYSIGSLIYGADCESPEPTSGSASVCSKNVGLQSHDEKTLKCEVDNTKISHDIKQFIISKKEPDSSAYDADSSGSHRISLNEDRKFHFSLSSVTLIPTSSKTAESSDDTSINPFQPKIHNSFLPCPVSITKTTASLEVKHAKWLSNTETSETGTELLTNAMKSSDSKDCPDLKATFKNLDDADSNRFVDVVTQEADTHFSGEPSRNHCHFAGLENQNLLDKSDIDKHRSTVDSCLPISSSDENVYESAAKLLFFGVKWARSIPSFNQVSI